MEKALRGAAPQGFARRRSLGRPVRLLATSSESQVREVIEASYRQLLGRVPYAAERLTDTESQLRDRQLSVAEFVESLATSDLFQQKLNRLAPLKAAQPAEASRFLAIRTSAGQTAALRDLLRGSEYAHAFGQDTVPYLRGMTTADGIPLTTVNRTAALYGGNAGLTPSPRGAV